MKEAFSPVLFHAQPNQKLSDIETLDNSGIQHFSKLNIQGVIDKLLAALTTELLSVLPAKRSKFKGEQNETKS